MKFTSDILETLQFTNFNSLFLNSFKVMSRYRQHASREQNSMSVAINLIDLYLTTKCLIYYKN